MKIFTNVNFSDFSPTAFLTADPWKVDPFLGIHFKMNLLFSYSIQFKNLMLRKRKDEGFAD